MSTLLDYYHKWKRNCVRTKIKQNLKNIEERRHVNNTWQASLELNIELLMELRAELLLTSNTSQSSIYINTGFKDTSHLFHWTAEVIKTLEDRDILGHHITNIMYHRKQVRLDTFLVTSKKKRYPVDALYINLLSELKTIDHHFKSIKDPRYYDRSYAALDQCWVDIIAIVETLCTLGVTHE